MRDFILFLSLVIFFAASIILIKGIEKLED